MKNKQFRAEIKSRVEFYDVDSMKVVYHGNYVRYYEQARCDLLNRLGYNYNEMEASGYAWPVVSMEAKYIRPLLFGQEFTVEAILLEYENRIKIAYRIYDCETGTLLNKGTTTQMAIDMSTGESQLVSPPCLISLVEKQLMTGVSEI